MESMFASPNFSGLLQDTAAIGTFYLTVVCSVIALILVCWRRSREMANLFAVLCMIASVFSGLALACEVLTTPIGLQWDSSGRIA